jgi:threonine aldolase
MGNLCAILAHTQRGDEVLLGELSHIFQNEAGAYAVFGGLHARTVPNRAPCPSPEDVAAAIRPSGIQFPRTGLLCLENTHNWLSGAVVTPAETRALCDLAHARGIPVHLDGARIFNAAVALGVDVRELTRPVDTVQLCFSKGLAAPVGSIVCGSRAVIERVRKARKMVGGAMRQSGVLAAACLVALETMRDRLAEDHAHARALAQGLAALPGVKLDPSTVVTNIVAFRLDDAVRGDAFRDACVQRGLKLSCYGGDWRKPRMVTHFGLGRAEVEAALRIVGEALAEAR